MAQIMNAFNDNAIEFQGLAADHDRKSQLAHWLANVLPATALTISPASADASFRSYYRAVDGQRSWIIMDAPVDHEDTEPFHRIAQILRRTGIAVPAVYAWDARRGFLLLEDFGNQTLLALRHEDPAASDRCYLKAIDSLITMQAGAPLTGLPEYDERLLRTELELFRQWLVLRHAGLSWSVHDERSWQHTCQHLVSDALGQKRVFVHRDYHSRNLMVLADQVPGVLDFQDAVAGPVFYDLVSLLKDCYVLPEPAWLERYLRYFFTRAAAHGVPVTDTVANRRLFHSMGMQRHLKAAGIFARLWYRDGKDGYLKDIPRTLSYLVEAAGNDERFEWLAHFTKQRLLPQLPLLAAS